MVQCLEELRTFVALDAPQYLRVADQMIRANERVAASHEEIGRAIERVDRGLQANARSFMEVQVQIGQTYQEQQRLLQGQLTLNRALERGRIAVDEFEQLQGQLERRYNETGRSIATASLERPRTVTADLNPSIVPDFDSAALDRALDEFGGLLTNAVEEILRGNARSFRAYVNEIEDILRPLTSDAINQVVVTPAVDTVADALREISQDLLEEYQGLLKSVFSQRRSGSGASLSDPGAFLEAWEEATEEVETVIKTAVEDALDGNIERFGEYADEIRSILSELSADLLNQEVVGPTVSAVGGVLQEEFRGVVDEYRSLLLDLGVVSEEAFNKAVTDLERRLGNSTGPELYARAWAKAIAGVEGILTSAVDDAFRGNLGSVGTYIGPLREIGSTLAETLFEEQILLPAKAYVKSAFDTVVSPALSNLLGGFTPVTSFALSGAGQALGLSTSAAVGGVIEGGVGGAFFSTAGGGSVLTGAGSTLVAAAPYIAAAVAGTLLLSGAFDGPPSVGPTGVGRFTNPFDFDNGVFTTDNGGDTRAVEAVGQQIAQILNAAQDAYGGQQIAGYGFDIGYFPNPEGGSGRDAGFTFKEIVDNIVANENLFEGLDSQQIVLEAVKATLTRGFENFDRDEVATALQNSAAETIEDLVSDLDFANALPDLFADAEDAVGPLITALDAMRESFDAAKERAEELSLSTDELATRYQEQVDAAALQFAVSARAEANNVLGPLQDLVAFATTIDQFFEDAARAGSDHGTQTIVANQRFSALIEGLNQSELNELSDLFSLLQDEVQGADYVIEGLTNTLATFGATGDAANDNVAAAALTQAEATDILAGRFQGMIGVINEQIGVLNQQIGSTDSLINALNSARDAIRSARLGNLVDPGVSILSSEAQLEEARRQAQSSFDAIFGGDEDERAAGRRDLPQRVRTLLEASRRFNASGPGFGEDFAFGQQLLADAETHLGGLVTEAEEERDILASQLSTLEASRDGIQDALDVLRGVEVNTDSLTSLLALLPSDLATDITDVLNPALETLEQTLAKLPEDIASALGSGITTVRGSGDGGGGGSSNSDNNNAITAPGGPRIGADPTVNAGTDTIQGLLTDIESDGAPAIVARAQAYRERYQDLQEAFGPNEISALINHFRDFGQFEGREFARGGVFRRGIIRRPTAFPLGLMGEAGPEAIMPLANVNGRLGVAANDTTRKALDALGSKLDRLIQVTASGDLTVATAVETGNSQRRRMASAADRESAKPTGRAA